MVCRQDFAFKLSVSPWASLELRANRRTFFRVDEGALCRASWIGQVLAGDCRTPKFGVCVFHLDMFFDATRFFVKILRVFVVLRYVLWILARTAQPDRYQ